MAPHLTPGELDLMKDLEGKGKTPVDIHARLATQRAHKGLEVPNLTNIRKALHGETYRRGMKETRGRKRTLSVANVTTLDRVRKEMIKKAKGEREVHWPEIIKRARVPQVDPSTAAKRVKERVPSLRARRPREKPMRSNEQEQLRHEVCKRWLRKPGDFFTKQVHLIMDNKFWPIPTNSTAKRFAKMRKVRFHLRTRAEGLNKGFTKPGVKKQRINPGASVSVCAGIIQNKVARPPPMNVCVCYVLGGSWCVPTCSVCNFFVRVVPSAGVWNAKPRVGWEGAGVRSRSGTTCPRSGTRPSRRRCTVARCTARCAVAMARRTRTF